MLKEPDLNQLAKETSSQLQDLSKIHNESLGLTARKFVEVFLLNAFLNESILAEDMVAMLEWLKFRIMISLANSDTQG